MGEASSRRVAAVILAGYGVLLLGVLLGPAAVPADGIAWIADTAARVGAPRWLLVGDRVEFVVNIGVIVPATALASVVWPRTTWRDWTAYGFLFSAAVELVQALLLPTRYPEFDDIVANTIGAGAGAALVLLVRWLAGLLRRPPGR